MTTQADDLAVLVRTGGPITTTDLLAEVNLMTKLGTWPHPPMTKLRLDDALGTMYASKRISFDPAEGWQIVYEASGQKLAVQRSMFD